MLVIVAVLLLNFMPIEIVSAHYDVNNDGEINAQDALEVWSNRGGTDLNTYDINNDGIINSQDAYDVWNHRGDTPEEGTSTIFDSIIEWIFG